MNTEMDPVRSIQDRVARLERENRWFRRAALAVTLLGGAAFLMAFAAGEDGGIGRFKQVDCGHIVIRDNDGQMRAWLGIAEGGPRLIFFDQSGHQRLGVGMTKEGLPALGIFDIGENPRVVLGMMEGWPGLVMRDPQGRKRVALFSREEWGSVYFYDRTETKRAGLGQFGEAAALNLSDDRGSDRVGVTTDRKGSSLSFFDAGARKRAGFGILDKDEPALGYFDHDGNNQMALSVIDEEVALNLYGTNRTEAAIIIGRTNGPAMRIYDGSHQVLWKAP
jgi:hypothetical protein